MKSFTKSALNQLVHQLKPSWTTKVTVFVVMITGPEEPFTKTLRLNIATEDEFMFHVQFKIECNEKGGPLQF